MTRAAKGDLQFDLWGVEPTDHERWAGLRQRIAEHGLRNSYDSLLPLQQLLQ